MKSCSSSVAFSSVMTGRTATRGSSSGQDGPPARSASVSAPSGETRTNWPPGRDCVRRRWRPSSSSGVTSRRSPGWVSCWTTTCGVTCGPPTQKSRASARRKRQLVARLNRLDEARDEFRILASVEQLAPLRVEKRALFQGEPCARRGAVLLLAAARGLRVVASYDCGELAPGDATDLHGDDRASERAAGRRPDLVDEVRAAALALTHLCGDARLFDRARPVAAHDAEAVRANPLERLLLPLDADAELRQSKTPATDLARRALRLHARHARQTRVAVEAVRVGDQRPERLRACAQVVLPAVVKFSLRHFLSSVAGTRRVPRGIRRPRALTEDAPGGLPSARGGVIFFPRPTFEST